MVPTSRMETNDGNTNPFKSESSREHRDTSAERQLKTVLTEEKQHENEANILEEKLILSIDSEADGNNIQTENVQQSLLEKLFGNAFPITIEAVGGELCVFSGTQEVADRITKKFRIMKKLGVLVGCGLDCHFRMMNNRYLLMMLIRGAPMAVFGSTVTMVPDMTNIRMFGSHPDFVEDGQRKFLKSILQLLPSRLQIGKEALLADLDNGEESERVQKFYEFLKPIRRSVMAHTSSSIVFAWCIPDNTNEIREHFAEEIRKTMQMCGDNQLVSLEQLKPGYSDAWQREWGIAPLININEIMDI